MLYNKQIREKADSPIKQAQLVMLEMFKQFDAICSKHQLQYWMDAGTLLGAIRHKGFIPWDDDLDVCMPREDYEKFLKLAPKELPEDIFLQTSETEPGLPWKWAKLRDRYSTFIQKSEAKKEVTYHQGIFIDIFPYDLIKTDFKVAKLILNRRFQRSSYPIVKKSSWLINNLLLLPIKGIGYKRIKKMLLSHYSAKKPCYISTGIDITMGYHTFNTNTIFPLKPIFFEDYYFMAPANPHLYLKQMFGDYMKLPPEEKRKVHAHQILPFTPCKHPLAKKYI